VDTLQQPVPPIHTVHRVVAAPALAVMAGCLPHDQAQLDCIAQADQTVAELGLAVESLDLVLQVVRHTDGVRQMVAGAYQRTITRLWAKSTRRPGWQGMFPENRIFTLWSERTANPVCVFGIRGGDPTAESRPIAI
jgi:hypothetical protein